MIGAIIGDIAGSVYEFGGIKTKDFPLFGDHGGHKCRFTDDSAMTLAVAGALLEAAEEGADLSACAVSWMQRVGRDHRDAGYGGSFLRWLFSDEPKPYNSYGNGSAMRVSPAAWAAGSLEEALRNADAITAVTHDHPEGMKGGRAVAACVYLARTGADKEAIRDHVRRNYYPLKETLAEIRPHYRFDVTCQGSVPQAIQELTSSPSGSCVSSKTVLSAKDSSTAPTAAAAAAVTAAETISAASSCGETVSAASS